MNAPVPVQLASPSGLRAELNANGSLRRIDHGDIMLNLFPGNEVEGGPANIFLRRHDGDIRSIPLLGPNSPASFGHGEHDLLASGRWDELRVRLRLTLARSAPAWFWHVEIENRGDNPVTCDLIHTQDLGLAHYGAVRLNEYYVSQYVDHTPLTHPRCGTVVASRQNQPMGGRCPWTVIGSLGQAVSFATDALQFLGLAARAGTPPAALRDGLPGKRLQHEHSMVAIQEAPFVVEPGSVCRRGFFGWFEPDKPTATTPADLGKADRALALPEASAPPWPGDPAGPPPGGSLFATAPLLECAEPGEAALATLFGGETRHPERDGSGRLLSFFAGERKHVALMAKELAVLRPHGHILRTGGALTPDESALTSTCWMDGVFHSMVTQGHVSINRFLSTCHGYLGLFRSHGQRVFAEIGGRWQLLDVPSAFEMAPDSCRWVYRHRQGSIEVVSSAPADRHQLLLSLAVLQGEPVRFLVSHHVALHGDDGSLPLPAIRETDGDGVFLRAVPDSDVGRRFPDGGFRIAPAAGTVFEAIGGDEMLFADERSRNQPFLCVVTGRSLAAGLVIEGRLVESAAPAIPGFWASMAGPRIAPARDDEPAAAARRLAEFFPWLVHNALVHYLSPRGLEQYSGGGWGTRDVCQGPVELLLALGRPEPVRDLLCRVLRQQNPDGDWPQWFMFFERERNIRPGDSHGDIVYWPLLALAQYLAATGDAGLLDVTLPFFHPDGPEAGETASVRQHVARALDLIRRRVIRGTRLAAYGHGDWNDSLQPAKPEMRQQLCSSWTVTLNHQTFTALAAAFRHLGEHAQASELETAAAAILDEFRRLLVIDGVVAGLAYFHPDGRTEHLLHPRDRITGLSYSLLPMIHAIINDMFTPAEAQQHLDLVRRHLRGPDGARLFDRPLPYHGGPQIYFQRAESASFFGREIGLMYTHAHLRYCEALARVGDAEEFFRALCQCNPIAVRELVSSAAPRQANCYFSSSDAAFADRYEAFEKYDQVNRGEIPLEGGWRIYSSGAGITARLIMQCFLGLRQERGRLVIDPAIPPALDGLEVELVLSGHPVEVIYQIRSRGHGPLTVELNGQELEFARERNPYRTGGVRVPSAAFFAGLTGKGDRLKITLE